MKFRQLVFEQYGEVLDGWVSDCETYAIRYQHGHRRPYTIMKRNTYGGYDRLGTSEQLLKAQRSCCYRANIPIPAELEYDYIPPAFNPPRLVKES